MKQSNLFTLTKPQSYYKLAISIFLVLFAGKFIFKDALPYFGFEQETFGHYWDYKWALIGHISSGLLALVLGPFQFWKAFRNKYLTVHRWMGRTYLTAILIGTISSTSLAWTSAIEVNFAWTFGLQSLAFAWITTASMAYISVIRKRILQHKEWMIRSYVVTFAFVTFRWLNELTIVKILMPEFIERGPTIIWFCWTIPLLITEIVLSWNKK
jgi:hypothetical protein